MCIRDRHGLERYRQFNIGRQDAFLDSHRGATGNVPAASAIGLAGGPLSVAFLAGATPALAVENPRQVSAYLYPADYGPRSPTFSRAVRATLSGQEALFVSGTASIVGHRTVPVSYTHLFSARPMPVSQSFWVCPGVAQAKV